MEVFCGLLVFLFILIVPAAAVGFLDKKRGRSNSDHSKNIPPATHSLSSVDRTEQSIPLTMTEYAPKKNGNNRLITQIVCYFFAALTYGIIYADTKANGAPLPPISSALVLVALATLATLVADKIAPRKNT